MPDGGTLALGIERAVLDGEYAAVHAHVRPGPYVRLSVSDTGCGMDEQTEAAVL